MKKIFQLKLKTTILGKYHKIEESLNLDNLKMTMDTIDEHVTTDLYMVIVDQSDNLILMSKHLNHLLYQSIQISQENKKAIFATEDKYLFRKMKEKRVLCTLQTREELLEMFEEDSKNESNQNNVYFLNAVDEDDQ